MPKNFDSKIDGITKEYADGKVFENRVAKMKAKWIKPDVDTATEQAKPSLLNEADIGSKEDLKVRPQDLDKIDITDNNAYYNGLPKEAMNIVKDLTNLKLRVYLVNYAKTGNKGQALKVAGYSQNTEHIELQIPNFETRLKLLQEILGTSAPVTVEKCIMEIKKIAEDKSTGKTLQKDCWRDIAFIINKIEGGKIGGDKVSSEERVASIKAQIGVIDKPDKKVEVEVVKPEDKSQEIKEKLKNETCNM